MDLSFTSTVLYIFVKNKNMISKFKYEYLLFFIAIIWVSFFAFVLQFKSPFLLEGDEVGYLSAAKKIYLNFKVDDARPLFISLINGFPLLFSSSNFYIYKWVLLVNLLSWFFTIILVYKIASQRLNKKTGFFISLIFLFCIGNLAITYKFLSESVFIFMLVLSIYFLNRYLISKKYCFLSITIAVLLLSILVKPLSMGLVILLILFYVKKLKKIIYNKYSILILFSFGLLFFQMYSLKKEHGNFTISYIDSFTYYNYLGTRADCLKNNTEFIQGKNDRYTYFIKLSSFEQRKIANNDLRNQLFNNPQNLLKAYFINIYVNSSKGSASVHGCKNYTLNSYFKYFHFIFKLISKMQNLFFTILGIYLCCSFFIKYKKQDLFFLIISVTILYVLFISAISSDQGDRFHIVIYPLIILLLINTGWLKNKHPV